MSEATTAAVTENATPEVQATAPEVQATQVEETTKVEQAPAEAKTEVQAEPAAEEPDFSFVPAKFLKDGKPDWERLVKAHKHAESLASKKGLLVPQDVSEYEWQGNAPIQINEEQANAFKAEAQKVGLTKEQYAFVMDKYAEVMTNTGFSADASAHALKKVWGEEFQSNVNLARRAFDEFAPSDMNMDDPIFNHPTVVRLLARMGQELGEDSQSTKGSTGYSAMTKAQVDELMKAPDYWRDASKRKAVEDWYKRNS